MSTKFYYPPDAADAWGYIEQPAKKRWSPETGWQTVRTWRGPRANEAGFLAGKGFIALASIDVDYDGDVAVVTLSFVSTTSDTYQDPSAITQQDPYFIGWTLSGNSIQSEIAAKQGFGVREPSSASDSTTLGSRLHSQVLSAQRQWKADIDAAIAAQTYPLKADGTEFDLATYRNYITDSANLHRQGRARYLFYQQINKNDTWETSQPVVRKVQTLRSTSDVKASVSYVNRMFTWGALKVHEPTLPDAIILSINALDDLDSQFSYVWRKRMPVVEISNDGKRMVTQEYWAYEAYDDFLYGQVITSSGSALSVPSFPEYGSTDPFLAYNT